MAELEVLEDAYRLKISSEQEKTIAEMVLDDIENALRDTTDLRDKIKNYNEQYEGVTQPKNFPWTNAANLHIPVTAICVDAIHARLLGTVFNVEPIVIVKGKDREKALKVQEILNYYWDVVMNFKSKIDKGILKALIEGVGVYKLIWKEAKRRIRTLELATEAVEEIEEIGSPKYNVIEREELIYQAPELETIPLYDVIVPARARDLQTCKFVCQRVYLRWSDLKAREKEKKYRNVEKIKDRITEEVRKEEAVSALESAIGISMRIETELSNKIFEVYEYWGGYDIDGDGIEEECVFTVEKSTRALLEARRNWFLHGRRPFTTFTVFPREGFFYGMGLCERLEALQAEINTVHNDRLNNQAIAIAKVLKARKGSGFDPTLQEIYPGATIFLEDLNDVQVLELGDVKQSSFIEEPILREYVEKATGVTDYTLGMGGRYRTGRGTATGTLALIQEGNTRFDVLVERLRNTIRELAEMTIQLCQQFLPELIEIQKKILGKDEVIFEEISKEDIQGKFHYIPMIASRYANPIIDRQEKMQLYALLTQNPLVMGNPGRVYNLTKEILLSMNVKNYEDYIGTSEELEAEIRRMELQRAQQRQLGAPIEEPTEAPPQARGRRSPRGLAGERRGAVAPAPPLPPTPGGLVV